ncbi:hypothetical protein P3T76_010824 [Phytophthora citrophthora]|uniref:Uncharacterized protein n=1 Tax=Phytophthora citrophthora TaxID=4793 RepID=A0AAD9GAT5_9STRA|nr:hypothetical protein P3T76_010824 [Phytophthora citrophthora]
MSSASNSVELYMVLSNKSGRQNLGTYLRTASAFGTTQVLVGKYEISSKLVGLTVPRALDD